MQRSLHLYLALLSVTSGIASETLAPGQIRAAFSPGQEIQWTAAHKALRWNNQWLVLRSIGILETELSIAETGRIKDLAGGIDFFLTLDDSGTAAEWSSTGAKVAEWENIHSIAAQGASRLLIRNDGTLLGSPLPYPVTNATQVAVASGNSISAGGLVLKSDGTVDGWGPVRIPALSNVQSVALGKAHGLALLENGTILSWWDHSKPAAREAAAPPWHPNNAVAVAASGHSSAVLFANGEARAWGSGRATVTNYGVTAIHSGEEGDFFSGWGPSSRSSSRDDRQPPLANPCAWQHSRIASHCYRQ